MGSHETVWSPLHEIDWQWLDIDDQLKQRKEYFYGWYCGKCNATLKLKGEK